VSICEQDGNRESSPRGNQEAFGRSDESRDFVYSQKSANQAIDMQPGCIQVSHTGVHCEAKEGGGHDVALASWYQEGAGLLNQIAMMDR
jgi:hypothetical protein